ASLARRCMATGAVGPAAGNDGGGNQQEQEPENDSGGLRPTWRTGVRGLECHSCVLLGRGRRRSNDVAGVRQLQNVQQVRRPAEGAVGLFARATELALVLRYSLQRIDVPVEKPVAVRESEGTSDQLTPVPGEFLIPDALKRGKAVEEPSFPLLLKCFDRAAFDRVQDEIDVAKPAGLGDGVTYDLATLVDRIEKGESDETAVTVEGEKSADVGLFAEDDRPAEKGGLAPAQRARSPPGGGDRLHFIEVDRCETFLGDV